MTERQKHILTVKRMQLIDSVDSNTNADVRLSKGAKSAHLQYGRRTSK